jgi:uncharacterized protein YacL
MARYTYDPKQIISLAQAILSYTNGMVSSATLGGGILGAVVGLIIGAFFGAVSVRSDGAGVCSFLIVVMSTVFGASIFRSAAERSSLLLRASAQMLLLMVRIEENTRPE